MTKSFKKLRKLEKENWDEEYVVEREREKEQEGNYNIKTTWLTSLLVRRGGYHI